MSASNTKLQMEVCFIPSTNESEKEDNWYVPSSLRWTQHQDQFFIFRYGELHWLKVYRCGVNSDLEMDSATTVVMGSYTVRTTVFLSLFRKLEKSLYPWVVEIDWDKWAPVQRKQSGALIVLAMVEYTINVELFNFALERALN